MYESDVVKTFESANQVAALTIEANDAAHAMAIQIGYQGAVNVAALEDEIRFYQRRSVEALLETGKRLLVLKELTPHGQFAQRVEMLGFHIKSAQRFMQAALKTSKSDKLSLLSTQVKSASGFLELVTHDDDVLENLVELDDVEKMSASQLRAALREAREEKTATDKVLADKNAAMDKLRGQLKRIQSAPRDQQLLELQKEATSVMNDALGAIRGQLRQALIALRDFDPLQDQSLFSAGLVGQLAGDLASLREEFNLPDVSTAAERELLADTREWAFPSKAEN